MTIIDRVARALYEESSGRSDWDEETEWMDDRQRAYWRDMARAALRETREPTEGMMRAGGRVKIETDTCFMPIGSECAGETFAAMIGAALAE